MKKKNSRIVALLFFAVAILLFGIAGRQWYLGHQERQRLEQLRIEKQLAEEEELKARQAELARQAEAKAEKEKMAEKKRQEEALREEENKKTEILPKYKELHRQNEDMVGWLTIEDTTIDYPVMFTPEQGDVYLTKNFELKKSYHGLPFIDKRCQLEPRSTNLLIHGHNMRDGQMFGVLENYLKEDYYKKHPIIKFDTLHDEGIYDIVGVIQSKVFMRKDKVFKYYQFINGENEQAFDDFISQIKQRSVYDTGVTAAFGDELITLSTCVYHVENGRLAIVAKRRKEEKE